MLELILAIGDLLLLIVTGIAKGIARLYEWVSGLGSSRLRRRRVSPETPGKE